MTMPARTRLPEFEAALQLANAKPNAPQPKCVGRDEYISDALPTVEQGRRMCEGGEGYVRCELFDLCKASALYEKPLHGVQGGIVWVAGRQLHLRRKKTPIELDLAS